MPDNAEPVVKVIEVWDSEPKPDVVIVRTFYRSGKKPTEKRYVLYRSPLDPEAPTLDDDPDDNAR